ncbi:hypothetical protein HPB47_024167 [Ixodes persulcatus]|uniref:Uncharacterized protein n=1 Tax=Ixodes persulcatus TaxID=34615 RepID=A0AC60Q815_IXOPE|nr:hypothetical protein HPB47_024167 [Ixodes persulcatus]
MAVHPPRNRKKQIIDQWSKITLNNWEQISSTQSFWCEVQSYKDACSENPFAELAGFVMSMLVLPYSNAEVERTHSQLNLVKSKPRKTLKPQTTNAILVARVGLKRHNKSSVAAGDLWGLQRRLAAGPSWPHSYRGGGGGGGCFQRFPKPHL